MVELQKEHLLALKTEFTGSCFLSQMIVFLIDVSQS